MRSAVRLVAPFVTAASLFFSHSAADASAWDEIRGSVYGTKTIADGRGIVDRALPAEGMRKVPIGITAAFKDGRTVKTITFLIDENPTLGRCRVPHRWP